MPLRSFDNPLSDEARQHLLDRRGERAHPKRHRTRKRAIRVSAVKRAKRKHRAALAKANQAKRLAAARAYWAGEATGHP